MIILELIYHGDDWHEYKSDMWTDDSFDVLVPRLLRLLALWKVRQENRGNP